MTSFVALRAIGSLAVVLALLFACAWALRKGVFGLTPMRSRSSIAIETATSLGDRRSLVIVNVEGRRLLLGLTPSAVGLLSELSPVPPEAATASESRA